MAGGKRRGGTADCRADTRNGPWVGIPKCLIDSPAYKDLSLHARAVLVELVARMNGYNNGRIAASQRELTQALRCSPRYIVAAVVELHEHGMLDVTAEGEWKQRKAREYRLTFVSTKEALATNEYLRWTPQRKNLAFPTGKQWGSDLVPTGKQRQNTLVPTGKQQPPKRRRNPLMSPPPLVPTGNHLYQSHIVATNWHVLFPLNLIPPMRRAIDALPKPPLTVRSGNVRNASSRSRWIGRTEPTRGGIARSRAGRRLSGRGPIDGARGRLTLPAQQRLADNAEL